MANPNMEWYLLAGMSDIPKIEIRIVNQPERGVIGIGEPPTVSTASAIANAVRNATGATVRSLPLQPAQDPRGDRTSRKREADVVKAFGYVNPTTEKDAVAALKADGVIALPLAGGQDLLARMKDYVTSADRIVNVKNALDAKVTDAPGGGLRIGAGVRIVDLAEHAQVAKLYPAIVAAAGEVGTPQIRNAGTVGGNLNQRPRCWYFRNEEFVCYKKGGNRCFSPAGENQFHAIFGNDGPSHIVHPSSLAVPFVAYGARFRVFGSGWRA